MDSIHGGMGPVTALRDFQDVRTGFFTAQEREARFNVEHGRDLSYERPWHVITNLRVMMERDGALFPEDVCENLPEHTQRLGEYPLVIDRKVVIDPLVVIDTRQGPVVIEEGVKIGSFALITGPCYLGAHTQVAAHTRIRGAVSVGPWCKVGGEIGATIIQSYSNKGHDGYLGDSWVGSWVNLGAMTTTSNLKNTYGNIRCHGEDTGLQFFGSVLGDYVKTAIGTRLNTGSVVGTGSMLALSSIAPRQVSAFSWLTDQTVDSLQNADRCYQFERFMQTAERMMQRRDVELSDELRAQISSLHAQTLDAPV